MSKTKRERARRRAYKTLIKERKAQSIAAMLKPSDDKAALREEAERALNEWRNRPTLHSGRNLNDVSKKY